MKYFSTIIALIFIVSLLGCKQNMKDENSITSENSIGAVTTIEINNLVTDSISIRALEYGDGKYWYGGSKGNYGSIDPKDLSIDKGIIKVNDSLDVQFRSIAVTNQYTYILSAGSPALLYRITHANDNIELLLSQSGDDVFYDSMKFWDDEEGIIMGDPQGEDEFDRCIAILKTENGGKEFGQLDCFKLPDYIDGEAGFAASNSNMKILNDHVWIATGGKAARVLYSYDRGVNWEEYQTPIIAGSQMTGIFAMDFYDEKTGVIIGGDWENPKDNKYNKAITKNGGRSWKLLSSGDGPGYCSDIQFVPNTQGNELLATGSQGVWWTGDQGTTWRKLTDDGYYTASMINQNEGMLAGNGKISSFKLERE